MFGYYTYGDINKREREKMERIGAIAKDIYT